MKTVKISFSVSLNNAIRLGYGYPANGKVEIQFDPSQLPQEDRELIANYVDHHGDMRVTAEYPTLDSLLVRLREKKRVEEEEKAKHSALVKEWREKPIEELLNSHSVRYAEMVVEKWGVGYEARKLVPERVSEAEELAEKRNKEQEAKFQAERDRIKTEKDHEEAELKAWAMEFGSELTKARIEEGFESWKKSVLMDRDQIVQDIADDAKSNAEGVLVEKGLVENILDIDDLVESYSTEDRLSPTLDEIKCLREVRKGLEETTTAKLVIVEQEKDEDEDYDNDWEPNKWVGIEIKVDHKFGTAERIVLIHHIK